MARFKDWVTGLTAAGTVDGSEVMHLVQGGASRKVSPAVLSSATPQPLGVASAGAGTAGSRDNHVHRMPDGWGANGVAVAPGTSWWGSLAPSGGFAGLVLNRFTVVPVVFDVTGTLVGVAAQITTAASAGGVLRFAAWAYEDAAGSGFRLPDVRLADFGTVASTSTGHFGVTGSLAVQAGVPLYIGLCPQVATCTVLGSSPKAVPLPDFVGSGQSYRHTSDVTGAAPDPFVASANGDLPMLKFRVD